MKSGKVTKSQRKLKGRSRGVRKRGMGGVVGEKIGQGMGGGVGEKIGQGQSMQEKYRRVAQYTFLPETSCWLALFLSGHRSADTYCSQPRAISYPESSAFLASG